MTKDSKVFWVRAAISYGSVIIIGLTAYFLSWSKPIEPNTKETVIGWIFLVAWVLSIIFFGLLSHRVAVSEESLKAGVSLKQKEEQEEQN